VTELLKELHRIVNEAIRTQAPCEDQAEGLRFDLSRIDLERLREEFAKKVMRRATAIQDIRDIVEQKLAEMLAPNPMRMDYQRNMKRSSLTTTARRTERQSRRPFGDSSSWSTASTKNRRRGTTAKRSSAPEQTQARSRSRRQQRSGSNAT
jgi:hypothetical protein